MKRRWLLLMLLPMLAVASEAEEVSLQEVYEAGLPVVSITTVNGEKPTFDVAKAPEGCLGLSIKNATKVPARLTVSLNGTTLYDSGDYEKDVSGLTVKVRGNTSAIQKKTPYKLKLQKKADLLCRGGKNYGDKNWALINDETLETMVGLKVNELVGLQWTPAYEYVNLIFNGEYRGLYMLIETVERNTDCRLNVDKSGYIFEYDAYWWNEPIRIKSKFYYSMQYTYKYPDCDKVTEEQHAYISDVVKMFEASLAEGTYGRYIDVNSFATWMVGHDILGCEDAAGSNIFLTKYDNTPDSKIMMGNMWDFNSCFVTEGDWDGMHERWFFDKLFKNVNMRFARAYYSRWNELKDNLFSQMDTYLADYANSEACKAFERSLVLDRKAKGKEMSSVADMIDGFRQWFASRKIWLDANITPPEAWARGDANCDGTVNQYDLEAIVDYMMGRTQKAAFDMDNADMNQDGGVDVADVVELIGQKDF